MDDKLLFRIFAIAGAGALFYFWWSTRHTTRTVKTTYTPLSQTEFYQANKYIEIASGVPFANWNITDWQREDRT